MSIATRYRLSAALAAIALSACGGAQATRAPSAAPPPARKVAETAPKKAAETPKPPRLRLGDAIRPISYRVHLTLDPSADSFGGEIAIPIELTRATDHMWLNGKALTIERATLSWNGASLALKTLPGGTNFVGFQFPKTVGPGRATLTVDYRGKVSKNDEMGLFRQKQDKRWYLYSQFEAVAARRAFPCFDEPSFKVPWQLQLTVDKGMVAVTNTPPVAKKTDPKTGKQTITFAKTKPLPSYLIAVAVGPFDVLDGGTVGRTKVPFHIVVPHGAAAGGAASYALANTPTFVKLLEDYFDMAYPYPQLDLIAVPSFLGGMENAGAITLTANLLLRKKAHLTSEFKQRYAHVITHELAHHWFGDLVTLAWWDDMWLNESFAEWLSTKLVYHWHPQWNGAVRRIGAAERAEGADSLPSARKLRQPVTSLDVSSLAGAITYAKGESVLYMFEHWLGEKTFQKGVRAYIRAHAWKSATSADFLAALSAASRPEVASAFKTFLDQAGVPLISAKLDCGKGATPTLELSQQRFVGKGATASADETWSVPVCVEYSRGRHMVHQCQLMTTKTATMKLEAERCPHWVVANDHATGYYRVAYPPALLHKLARARKLAAADKLGVMNDMDALVDTGKLPIAAGLSLLPSFLRGRDPSVTRQAAMLVVGLRAHMVPPRLHKQFARFVRRLFDRTARRLGWKAGKHDSNATRALRRLLVPLVAGSGHDMRLARKAQRLAKRWLKARSGIDPDMIPVALRIAGRYGDATLYSAFERAALAEKDPRYRRDLLTGMSAFRDPALLKKNFHLFLSGKFKLRDSFALLRVPGDWKQGDRLSWTLFKQNYAAIMKKIPPFIRPYVILGVSASICDDAHRKDAAAFFKERAKQISGGPHALRHGLERADRCIAQRKAQAPGVAAFLDKR